MVSTFTPNINIEEPARGDDVGTWDTPVNSNMTLIDLVTGANTAIGVGSGNVTLSIAQYRSAVLTFNSTLIQNTTITMPSTFTKPYRIVHAATGSSAFTITLATTVSGGAVVGVPPGHCEVYNDGTNLKFTMLYGPVGTYWDYAGSSVPGWVSASTVPPLLNCAGGTFSAGTYPQLAAVLGGTTLPDSQGRLRLALDAGTNRVTSGGCGIAGNTLLAAGGDQLLQSHLHSLSDPGHGHGVTGGTFAFSDNIASYAGAGAFPAGTNIPVITISHNFTGITMSNAGSGGAQNMPPAYVGGLTLIRAA